MYVHIFGYFVNKLEIWWVYLSPIGINSIAHQSMKISKWIISLIFLILGIVAYLTCNTFCQLQTQFSERN